MRAFGVGLVFLAGFTRDRYLAFGFFQNIVFKFHLLPYFLVFLSGSFHISYSILF